MLSAGVPAKSPLKQPRMSPDGVVLEAIFVRVPAAEAPAHEEFWKQVDEQRLPADTRRQLAENGLRVGLLGGQFPEALARWMALPLDEKPADAGNAALAPAAPLTTDSPVSIRHFTARNGQRAEIVTSDIQETLSPLWREAGQVRGRTYHTGQGMLALLATPQGDGRARIELVPELHHGDARLERVPMDGGFEMRTGRSREVFDQLRFEALLAPGEMVVVAGLPDRSGSLGHYLLASPHAQPGEQKILVLRLAQTQQDELFE